MRAKNSPVVEIFVLTKLGIGRGLLIDHRRLVTIVPPGLRDAARVARLGRGPTEHVPIGEPVRSLVPVRNPIDGAQSAERSELSLFTLRRWEKCPCSLLLPHHRQADIA